MKYLSDLQELRGLSITFVILFHYDIIKKGFYGVDIFILISGFLIYEKYNKTVSLYWFYTNRIIRIITLSYLIEFVTLYYFSNYSKNNILNIIDEYNSGLIFTSNIYYYYSGIDYFLSTTKRIFLHYWYISMDVHFYLIYPFFHKLNFYYILIFYFIYLYINRKNSELSYYIVLTRIYEYMLGSVGYLFRKKSNRSLKIISYFILIIVVLIPFSYINLNNLAVLIFTVTYLTNKANGLDCYLLEMLGNISYGVYLIHYPLSIISKSFINLPALIPICIILNKLEKNILLKINKSKKFIRFIILYYIICRSYSYILFKRNRNTYIEDNRKTKKNNCCDNFNYNKEDILIIGDSHAYRFLIYIAIRIARKQSNIYWKYVNSGWIVRNNTTYLHNIKEKVNLIISMNMMSRRKFGIFSNITLFYTNYIKYLKTKCTYLIVFKPTPIFNFSVNCNFQMTKRLAIIGYNISLYPFNLDIKYTSNLILKDLSKYYCKGNICNLIYKNRCIYNDYNHLNPSFLTSISNKVKKEILIYFSNKSSYNNTCNSFIIYDNKIPYNWLYLRNKCIKSYFTKLDFKL